MFAAGISIRMRKTISVAAQAIPNAICGSTGRSPARQAMTTSNFASLCKPSFLHFDVSAMQALPCPEQRLLRSAHRTRRLGSATQQRGTRIRNRRDVPAKECVSSFFSRQISSRGGYLVTYADLIDPLVLRCRSSRCDHFAVLKDICVCMAADVKSRGHRHGELCRKAGRIENRRDLNERVYVGV